MIGVNRSATVEIEMDEFCGALAAHDLQPLWKMAARLMPKTPRPVTIPWLWKWDDVLPLAEQAGRLITIERGGERRVLAFANPGLGGLPFSTSTLWGAYQYLGPGEHAPAHRHSSSAVRFVLTGSGVYTTVNGDACAMEPGDLVLTPNWNWHDHNSTSDQPMVWFDGLDLPLATTLDAIFFEPHPLESQPVDGHNLSEQLFSGLGLREMGAAPSTGYSPLLRYKRADTDRALSALHKRRGSLHVSLEYTDPLTGGPAVPTFASEMHRVYPGGRTATKRKTGSSVYVVFAGRGRSVINGETFEWGKGDVFVTPSWAAVDHEADEAADLFAVSDRPVLAGLHLYREEELATRQAITGVFSAEARLGAAPMQVTSAEPAR